MHFLHFKHHFYICLNDDKFFFRITIEIFMVIDRLLQEISDFNI